MARSAADATGLAHATVSEGWSGVASPVWGQAHFYVDGRLREPVVLLDPGAGRVALVDLPFTSPPLWSYAFHLRSVPGGRVVQVEASFGRPRPQPYEAVPQEVRREGPFEWDPATGALELVVVPSVAFPWPVVVRDGRGTRYGVVEEYEVDETPRRQVQVYGFYDPRTGNVLARVAAEGVSLGMDYPGGDVASAPGGQVMAVRTWFGEVALIDVRDGGLLGRVAEAELVGCNPWSPSGRSLMIYDKNDPAGRRRLDWWVYDTVTRERRRVGLDRANAPEFGPLSRPANLLGWLDDSTVVLSTTKGRQTVIFQIMDLKTGHREPLIKMVSADLAPTPLFGVPDAMHLWEPLLPTVPLAAGHIPSSPPTAPADDGHAAQVAEAWDRAVTAQHAALDRRDAPGLDEAMELWAQALSLEYPPGGPVNCAPDLMGLRRTRPSEKSSLVDVDGVHLPEDLRVTLTDNPERDGRVAAALEATAIRLETVDEHGQERTHRDFEEAQIMGEEVEFPFSKYVSDPTHTDGTLRIWFDLQAQWWPHAYITAIRILAEELTKHDALPAHLTHS